MDAIHTKRRVLRRLMACIAIGTLGAGAYAASSQATLDGAPDCTGIRSCIYDDNEFEGLIGSKVAGAGLSNVLTANNDRMDSWWNETDSDGRWYYDINGGGSCTNLAHSWFDPDIAVFPSDELSSWANNGFC